MHRTQIYFEEAMFELLKQRANRLGISVSAYIRGTLEKDLDKQHTPDAKPDFSEFAGIWADRDDITLKSIREKAWK